MDEVKRRWRNIRFLTCRGTFIKDGSGICSFVLACRADRYVLFDVDVCVEDAVFDDTTVFVVRAEGSDVISSSTNSNLGFGLGFFPFFAGDSFLVFLIPRGLVGISAKLIVKYTPFKEAKVQEDLV